MNVPEWHRKKGVDLCPRFFAIIGDMKKALVPLADGFEDIEAVAVIDILRRGGVEVVTAALGPKRTARSAHGIPTLRALTADGAIALTRVRTTQDGGSIISWSTKGSKTLSAMR